MNLPPLEPVKVWNIYNTTRPKNTRIKIDTAVANIRLTFEVVLNRSITQSQMGVDAGEGDSARNTTRLKDLVNQSRSIPIQLYEGLQFLGSSYTLFLSAFRSTWKLSAAIQSAFNAVCSNMLLSLSNILTLWRRARTDEMQARRIWNAAISHNSWDEEYLTIAQGSPHLS